MYLEGFSIENSGPIDWFRYTFSRQDNGRWRPLVLVGTNGAGKSIVLSHLVNAYLSARGEIFENNDIAKNKVYKLRSTSYIRNGADYSYSKVLFESKIKVEEIQLRSTRGKFESDFGYCVATPLWPQVPEQEWSIFTSNFSEHRVDLEKLVRGSSHLYFPPNRFEEPAWLNQHNLLNKSSYIKLNNLQSQTDQPMIVYSPMRDNQDWLLDLIYDAYALEQKLVDVPAYVGNRPFGISSARQQLVRHGPANILLEAVTSIIGSIFNCSGPAQYSVGRRGHRAVSVSFGNQYVISNLFSLSTGQSLILNIFLTILRGYDTGQSEINSISEVKSVVIIDEIDAHLHADLLYRTLPSLIELLPSVQFIVTAHSPLFLMGMTHTLGADGFDIVELPNGLPITAERFREFETAYGYYKETQAFELEKANIISRAVRPIVFFEGQIDVDYVKCALHLFGRTDLSDAVEIAEGGGHGGLTKIARIMDSGSLASLIPNDITVVYDCDVPKANRDVGRFHARALQATACKIKKGIENLLSDELIEKVAKERPEFFNRTNRHARVERGVEIVVPESWSVNDAEKRNLCDWVAENATSDDLRFFSAAIAYVEEAAATSRR